MEKREIKIESEIYLGFIGLIGLKILLSVVFDWIFEKRLFFIWNFVFKN